MDLTVLGLLGAALFFGFIIYKIVTKERTPISPDAGLPNPNIPQLPDPTQWTEEEIQEIQDAVEAAEEAREAEEAEEENPQPVEEATDLSPVDVEDREDLTATKSVDKMTVAELKEYATANGIDLGGAKLKKDILAAVQAA